MLILRIRQAEVAADAGRLDEAYEIVWRDARFKSNRRGQEAITRIVADLVRRGREHLAAGRLPQAGTDCDKAARLGGELAEVVQLRDEIRVAHEARQRGQRDAALALAAARRHVEAGALSVGRRLVAEVDDSRAKRLMTDIDDHRGRLETAIAVAISAKDRRDWPAAAEAIVRAREIAPADVRLAEITRHVADSLAQQAQSELESGRLDRATLSVASLRQADPDSPTASEINRAIEHCRRASQSLDAGRAHEAAEILRRVSVLFPKAGWINGALKHLQIASDALSELRAGPLSLVTDDAARWEGEAPAEPKPNRATDARLGRSLALPGRASAQEANTVPERFILQVDGAGAFLVVRGGVAKVGPISSAALPDVALVADAAAPAVTIERVEDDYFLRSPTPVSVNDRPVTEALLGSGDRIGLSPRCRFTFAIPHAASTTAVLDLVGARYPRGDVRRVVLLDRDIVLGAGPSSHVRLGGSAEPFTLNLRGGLLRTSVVATVNGKPLGREEGLPVGVPISAGGASFVISRV